MRISVSEAQGKFPELIKAVEAGASVTVCRDRIPVVDIVRTKQATRKKRTLGTLAGKIQINDPDWWKPMSDRDVKDVLGRR